MAYDTQEERLKVRGSEQITRDLKVNRDVFVGGDLTVNNASLTTALDKLDGIESGAEVNVQADWDQTDTSADDYIKNKPNIPPTTIPDTAMSDTSSNPVENKVIKEYVDGWMTATFGKELGKVWKQATGTLRSKKIDFFVYSGDIFVCGNKEENDFLGLWWSEDGKTWNQSSDTTGFSFIHDLQYANGLWQCAVYNQGFWWSEDGKNWTKGTGFSSTLTVKKVVYGNNKWVGIDYAGGLWYSTDGKAWQAVSLSELSDKSGLESVEIKFANGLFQYLMDYTYHTQYFDLPVYLAFWSNDGINWTLSNLNDTGGEPPTVSTVKEYTHILYTGSKWFVFGAGGLKYASDGKSWSSPSGSIASYSDINTISYGNGTWLCGTNSNGVWYSINAQSWTKSQGESLPSGFGAKQFTYANGLWVLCASSNFGVWWSEDGSWWRKGVGDLSDRTPYLTVYTNGLWLATVSGGLFYSEDGRNWYRVTGIGIAPYTEHVSGLKSTIFTGKFWIGACDYSGGSLRGIWYSRDLNDLITDGTITL